MLPDRRASSPDQALEDRTVCVDIDHTLYRGYEPLDYVNGSPIPGAVEALERLRADGWTIVLFTARHFNHWRVTRDWLEKAGVCYDQLVFGKPPARYYIDDRAIPFRGSWDEVLRSVADG